MIFQSFFVNNFRNENMVLFIAIQQMSSLKQVINYLTIPVGQELQSGLTAQDFS